MIQVDVRGERIGRRVPVQVPLSSTESFPLFGYDLADYETLFEEKTQLFAELLKGGPVTWQGTTRPALRGADVVPHLEAGPFPVWLGVGGSPESVVRAARYGQGLMLAIIGGPPRRFVPFSELFAAALEKYGRPTRPLGVHAPGHIATTDEEARDELWPHYREVLTRVGRTRGWPPPSKDQFVRETGPDGAWHGGSPDSVARKIAANLPALGASRFDPKYGMVGLPHETIMRTIEQYRTQVVPFVREMLADTAPAA